MLKDSGQDKEDHCGKWCEYIKRDDAYVCANLTCIWYAAI